jgi:carbon storage regulator
MLILSRKLNECIVIDGRILIKVVRVDGEIVKLGIQAPPDIPVHRQEVYEEIQRNNQEALTRGRPMLPKLSPKSAVAPTIPFQQSASVQTSKAGRADPVLAFTDQPSNTSAPPAGAGISCCVSSVLIIPNSNRNSQKSNSQT